MELTWLQNDPPRAPEPDYNDGMRDRQAVLFGGLDCLRGQIDLFPIDANKQGDLPCEP